METTNNTDDETEYRTTSRPPKSQVRQSPWIPIGPRQKVEIPHPPCPFAIEFRVNGEIVCCKEYRAPQRRVGLEKVRDKYQCRRLVGTAQPTPRPAPQPPPRQTHQPAPDPKSPQSRPRRPARLETTSKPPQPSRGRTAPTGARA